MRAQLRAASLLSIACAFVACSDDPSVGAGDTAPLDDATDAPPDGAPPDVALETVDFDTAPPETSAPEVIDPGGDFGQPCAGNTDCESGWCVESPLGYVCTKECLEECPTAYDCKSVQNAKGDVTFLCLPRVQKVCVPCLEDFQCNGGACLEIDGSSQCASPCDGDDDCPDGYACNPDASGQREGGFCQPRSGACDCSPPYAGVTRVCTSENAIGTCIGIETCDPEVGWVGCNARQASDETCDYIDNDCDGAVDEGFQEDGIYASADGCGSCTTSCDALLANAAETECFVEAGLARCRVLTCEPGYTLLNPFVCAPDVGTICQPCQVDAECVGNGAACTTLDDGAFCTRGCDDDDDCSEGFVCADTGAANDQCVPASGSCTCDGSNTDLARACSITLTPDDPDEPVVICKGFEQCTPQGWGACDLPDDACDGIDNDCDGVIDGPHKTGDKYTALEHCGACDISCLALTRPNAVPICDAGGAVPVCAYRCTGDAVDVNGRSDDGCECVPVPGPDLAGDDRDSNCDGVDGEVDNAIFVSKDGDDGNPGTIALPVLTIQAGLTKAAAQNKRDVYVATGVYSQNIVMVDGVGLFGGYAPDFFEHDVLLLETAIIGGTPSAQHLGTITAVGVGAAGAGRDTVVDGFTIIGINAGNTEGGNSYGIYVRDSGEKLRISHNRVFGGPGGNGKNGTRGVDGANGVDGGGGANAKSLSNNCGTSNESNGGGGGQRMCGAVDISGGGGGKARCPLYEETPGTAGNGQNGKGTGAGSGGTFGWPLFICANDGGVFEDCGNFGYGCGICYVPQSSKPSNASNGTNGTTGNNGARGAAGSVGGQPSGGQWVGNKGGDGGPGTNGSGGGGGGAGGGVEVEGTDCSNIGNDDVGGSGGGGGSGGCLGTGGTGGLAGGGSFAIFVVGSNVAHTPTIADNTLQGGRGGAGGNGGAGGVGGAAGKGGSGGVAGDALSTATLREQTRCARAGGDGGNGGGGGHGGGGGGGAGGPSYALFVSLPTAAPAIWKTDNDFLPGGQGGEGGAGGVSVDQSRSGLDGADGVEADANF